MIGMLQLNRAFSGQPPIDNGAGAQRDADDVSDHMEQVLEYSSSLWITQDINAAIEYLVQKKSARVG